jgi:nucleoside-diphosphate-sugar epimerase
VAVKTFGETSATEEGDQVSLHQDSPYSMSKIFGEFYACYYHKQHGLPVVRARFQNVYGPGEILGAGQWRGTPATVWRNVTPTFIYQALKGRALPVENGGIATRDFIYVADVVDGLLACAGMGKPGEAYNLASGRETSILAWAERINALAGNPAGIDLKPARDWDNSGRRFGATGKAREQLGFEAHVDADTGLRLTMAWTRSNLGLIEQAMARHAGRL